MAESDHNPETVTLTIDGRKVTVEKGTTILQAAEAMGNRVPHYCYHPGLTAPAQCRLCLVEIEGAPKLQPSCVTTAQDDQVVHTQSDQALRQRRGVLEFYLANHPLDCPICDQSGECKLQDYVHAEGRKHGRSREPKRVFGRDDFGGDVLFYGDRCVMCTRCVRFMNEMEQDPLLTVVERGNRSVIDTFFDEGLENASYAGNVVDICPVGALVSKDFLHKARAWDLDHTPSICPNCSQGCNIDLHTRDNRVQRLKPRANLDVNQYWMCDYGRHRYDWMNRGDRVEAPLVRVGESSDEPRTRAAGWREALEPIALRLDSARSHEVRAVASPFASNEELAALKALVDELGGGRIVFRSARAEDEVPLPGFPKLTRRRDLAPNRQGAEVMGMERVGDDDARGGLEDLADFDGILIVAGDELEDQDASFGSRAALYLYLGAHPSDAAETAHAVLPIATHAEQEGTFTNFEGRVQRFWPGIHSPGAARPGWLVLSALRAHVGESEVPPGAAEMFGALAGMIPEFHGLDYQSMGTRGAILNEPVALTGA